MPETISPTVPAAAVYLRVSLDLRDGERIEVHREKCRAICERLGFARPAEYVDNSTSAYKARGAKSDYARLLADVRIGRFAVLVCWDIDRLTRHPRELEDWLDITERHGLRIVTADGEVDTASENGRLYLRMRAAVARHEVEHMSRRRKDANAARAARGEPPTGRPLFGWDAPEHGQAVRDAADLVLRGGSLRSVCRTWNAAGYRTSWGNPWQNYALRDFLMNPRLAGLRVYKGTTVPGTWDGLITEETHRALVALLTDPARRTTDSTVRRWPLSGLATCGACGADIRTGGRSQRGSKPSPSQRTYRCSASNHMVRAAAPVEVYVSALVVERLSRPDAVDLLADDTRPDATELRTRAAALRSQLDGLARLFTSGALSEAGVSAESARLRAELADVEGQLADAGRAHALGDLVGAEDVAEKWKGLDADRKRVVIGALMTVTVHPPGRGVKHFDPDSVGIEWL